ncbi:MAG: molybdenum cofactor biosynthesis protein B [Haloarculaceae archaeon]
MVDFQSRDRRDTRREPETDDDEEDAPAEQASEPDATEETGEETTAPEEIEDAAGVGVAVVVVDEDPSDDDPAGTAVAEALYEAGYDVVASEFLRKDYDGVQSALDALVSRDDVAVVVTAGGTGLTAADVTIEAAHPLFEKVLPGFGELFRDRYAEQVGTAVVSTRATAGIADGVPVFCLPGEAAAARLGAADIVAPEAVDIVARLE